MDTKLIDKIALQNKLRDVIKDHEESKKRSNALRVKKHRLNKLLNEVIQYETLENVKEIK